MALRFASISRCFFASTAAFSRALRATSLLLRRDLGLGLALLLGLCRGAWPWPSPRRPSPWPGRWPWRRVPSWPWRSSRAFWRARAFCAAALALARAPSWPAPRPRPSLSSRRRPSGRRSRSRSSSRGLLGRGGLLRRGLLRGAGFEPSSRSLLRGLAAVFFATTFFVGAFVVVLALDGMCNSSRSLEQCPPTLAVSERHYYRSSREDWSNLRT